VATIGGEIRKIQDNVGEAAVSPDGSRIVFERDQQFWQIGPGGENPVLHGALDKASHCGARGEAYANCWNLAWSPDGQWFTYVRKTGDNEPPVLEAHNAEDGRTETILTDPDLAGYVWLSSSKIVLDRWEAPDKPFSNLWQINVDPEKLKAIGKPRRITNWAGFSVQSMSAGRDGKQLALVRRTDQSNVFVGELSQHGDTLSGLRRISSEDRVEWPGGWSADSEVLFFQSDRTGNMNIYNQRMDSTNAEPVVLDQDDNRAPVLSSDKKWIFYFAWPRSTPQVNSVRLMRKPIGGGSPELILQAKGLSGSAQTSYRVVMPTMTGQPAFRCPSQPGHSCVLSEAGPREVVFYSLAPAPAAEKSMLFRIDASNPNEVSWDLTPDGSRVAYSENDWQSATIHIRDLRTNTSRDILLKGMSELSTLSWSADARSFFATTFGLRGSSLFHVTLSGTYRLLYKGAKEIEGARPSPDGRYLAFGDVVSASNVWLVEGLPR
jgi:Tol biopolymer transport system component